MHPLIKSYKLLSQAKPLQQQKLAKNLGNYFLMIICILYIKQFSYQDTVRPHQLHKTVQLSRYSETTPTTRLVIPISVSQNFRKRNTKTVLISCDENT